MVEEVRETCKCGKPFKRLGKRYENHVASCDGTPFKRGKTVAAVKKSNALDATIYDLERRRDELGRDADRMELMVLRTKNQRDAIAAAIEGLKEAKKE